MLFVFSLKNIVYNAKVKKTKGFVMNKKILALLVATCGISGLTRGMENDKQIELLESTKTMFNGLTTNMYEIHLEQTEMYKKLGKARDLFLADKTEEALEILVQLQEKDIPEWGIIKEKNQFKDLSEATPWRIFLQDQFKEAKGALKAYLESFQPQKKSQEAQQNQNKNPHLEENDIKFLSLQTAYEELTIENKKLKVSEQQNATLRAARIQLMMVYNKLENIPPELQNALNIFFDKTNPENH